MKLKSEFILHNTGAETVLVPTGRADFSGVARGNATFGAILALLEHDMSEQAIVDALLDTYDAPRELVEKDVARALAELRNIGAIEE